MLSLAFQDLSLNVCRNEFDLHHFTMLYTCWTKNSSGVKLQYLYYSITDRIRKYIVNITQQNRDQLIEDTHQLIEDTMAKLASTCTRTLQHSMYST